MGSTTVRVSLETHELLKNLAKESAASMQEVLAKALERYRRELFLEGLNKDFQGAEDYGEELLKIDGTVADGLDL
ncbi:MAG: toxin-antitoxin system protein [Vulcanimicrobiota bacterium]